MWYDKGMRGSLEVVTGIAGSGKTSRLLDEYRQKLRLSQAAGEPGTTLWLTPTSRGRRALATRLLDETLPVCFQPSIFTFEAFADRILAASHRSARPLSDFGKRTVLRYVIDSLQSGHELTYFQPISDTAGFLDLVVKFISDLKRDETWPEHFDEACAAEKPDPRKRELGRIYAQYQDVLLRHNLYDAEGRFWSARDEIASGRFGPFESVSLIVVDGFTDFTRTQHDILEMLAERAERTLISLPIETEPRRFDLFQKSMAALDRFTKTERPGVRVTTIASQGAPEGPVALQHLARSLFDNPRTTQRLPTAEGIEIVAATGQIGEIDMLAQRVKRLLLAGTPSDQIVIAFRSLADYAELIEERFSDAGIPYACDAGSPLQRKPTIKALFNLLQLEAEDWPYERLLGVVGSNYFRPKWKEVDTRSDPARLSNLLLKLQIPSERQSMLKAARRYAIWAREQFEANPQRKITQDDVAGAAAGVKLLERLSEATANLRKSREFAAWVDVIVTLARELGFVPATKPVPRESVRQKDDLDARDRETWRRFEALMYDAARTRELIEPDSRPMPFSDFLSLLSDLVNSQELRDHVPSEGRVAVVDAIQVRTLEIDYLFLAGLTESSFPQRRTEDCLLDDAERRRLNERGLAMRDRSSQSQEEMLLFYSVVTRARRQLVLSYPAISQDGQPQFPSPYVGAIRDLFAEDALPAQPAGSLDPAPTTNTMLSLDDLRLVATLEVNESRPGLFRAFAESPATAAAARNILASADAGLARFQTPGFSNFEGRLQSDRHCEQLAALFPQDYEFSATQLERFATCAFRFFMSDVLKLEELPSMELQTDYLGRGMLVHDVLAALHQGDAHQTASGEQLAERFRTLVSERLGRRVHDSELSDALTNIERQMLDEWAQHYSEQYGKYAQLFAEGWDEPPRPQHFEIAFGRVPGTDGENVEVLHESIRFGSGANETRVRGRIDRVDVGKFGGRTMFTVIDYKSGEPPRFKVDDVKSGTAIQLALYTFAVMRLDLAGPNADPYQMAYWGLRHKGFEMGLKGRGVPTVLDVATIQSLEQILEETIPRLAAGIRAGNFVVFNTDKDCTGRCPYNTVCRVNQIRALPEHLLKRPQ